MSKKNSKSDSTDQLAKGASDESIREVPQNPAVRPRKSGSELFSLAKEKVLEDVSDEPQMQSPAVGIHRPASQGLAPVSRPMNPVEVKEYIEYSEDEDGETPIKASGAISKTVAEHLNTFYLQGPLTVAQFRLYSSLQEGVAALLIGYRQVGLLEQEWVKTKYVFKLSDLGKQRLDEYISTASTRVK